MTGARKEEGEMRKSAASKRAAVMIVNEGLSTCERGEVTEQPQESRENSELEKKESESKERKGKQAKVKRSVAEYMANKGDKNLSDAVKQAELPRQVEHKQRSRSPRV
jgi:hypothetical protein